MSHANSLSIFVKNYVLRNSDITVAEHGGYIFLTDMA